jgi:hypothetical protein
MLLCCAMQMKRACKSSSPVGFKHFGCSSFTFCLTLPAGFLSILVAVGVPALMFNHHVFRATVERLMKSGRISFDETVRKARSEVGRRAYTLQGVLYFVIKTLLKPKHAVMMMGLPDGSLVLPLLVLCPSATGHCPLLRSHPASCEHDCITRGLPTNRYPRRYP